MVIMTKSGQNKGFLEILKKFFNQRNFKKLQNKNKLFQTFVLNKIPCNNII